MEKFVPFFVSAVLVVFSGCIGGNQGADTGDAVSVAGGSVKTFALTGENFRFVMDGQEAPILRVKQGDTVRIEFSSTQGFHDWVVDEFNAATGKVNEGQSTSAEFVADEKGSFEYYCSVGQHRVQGMKGILVVE